jgi:hypothetical protein
VKVKRSWCKRRRSLPPHEMPALPHPAGCRSRPATTLPAHLLHAAAARSVVRGVEQWQMASGQQGICNQQVEQQMCTKATACAGPMQLLCGGLPSSPQAHCENLWHHALFLQHFGMLVAVRSPCRGPDPMQAAAKLCDRDRADEASARDGCCRTGCCRGCASCLAATTSCIACGASHHTCKALHAAVGWLA